MNHARVYYPRPLTRQPIITKVKTDPCLNAEYLSETILSIPSWIDEEELKRLLDGRGKVTSHYVER